MPKKAIITSSIVFLIVAILTGAFLFWHERKNSSNTDQPDTSNGATQATRPSEDTTEDEISSIKGLIDGEYQFPPVDTSNWKTYRNDELGFEVKMPKEWEMRNPYVEKGITVNLWFGQKGKTYEFEGGHEDAIIASFSMKTNPNFRYNEEGLISWHDNGKESIKSAIINGVAFYYHDGYGGKGISTTVDFPENYAFSLSSSLVLSEYPDVQKVLYGMMQTVKFDGIRDSK